jgi:class 3 adenylate cyclase/predicted ATPase
VGFIMDVMVWLRSLGLGQYEAAFRENEIDEKVLLSLTAEDLKELGVAALGHRRLLLDAIAVLRGQADGGPTTTPGPAAIDPSPRDTAERRQVTVMFSDLVGSTALSARMDPEDLREVISAYQKCVADTVHRFGGFVAKFMGDGVLIYFGYPQAHEDDAERAVGAGLELVAAVSGLKTHAALQTRVGIATGLVVVGDLIGSGASQEQAIVGETPNLAARLQGIAEPNSVVIAESTRKLVGNLFELDDLGPNELKGIARPVRAWMALRASSVESRFEAQHETKLTPLVGRDEELELLVRRWRQAVGGEGRVVSLSGEPGIGKSRLIVALEKQLQTEHYTPLRFFCSPLHTDSTLYPFISQLERGAGFERNDTMEAKLDKLSSLLGSSPNHDNDVQLLAELLSVPTGDRYPPLNLSARQKRQKTIEALVRQLEVLVRQRPVLMIFEDAHWIDPSSRELLDTTIERVARLPVLLVITFRPEFHPPWTGQAHVATFNLSRLGRREGAALAGSVAGNTVLPEEIIDEIIERTDGIPLFVEELTKAVVEARVRDDDEASTLYRVPPFALAIPATLHASLMARLDRLGAVAREVAQIGAAIGREFAYEVLAPIVKKTDKEVQTALGRLTDAQLVFCRGIPPQATFLFKHALVRDVAYGSLVRGQRQQLHGRIADVLAEHFPTAVEAEPEVIAHHYREAGIADAASTYFERAGDRAAARSAYIEATAHFRAAIEEADRLSQKDERARRALALLLKLGPAIAVTIGDWQPEVEAVFRRAPDLGREIGDGPQLFRATWGLWMCASRTDNKQSRTWTEELTSLAQWHGDEILLLEAQHCRWGDEFFGGDVPQLLETTEEGMRRYDATRHAQLAEAFGGHDPGVCALALHAMGLSLRGLPDQARRTKERALLLAESLSHPPSIGFAYKWVGSCLMIAGDRHGCEQIGARCVTLAEKFDLPYYRWSGRYLIGWAKAQGVTLAEALALMEEAFPPIAYEQLYKFFSAALAEVRFDAGRVADALALVDHAINTGEGPASGLYVPEIHRLRSVFLRSLGSPPEEVECGLRTALELAEEQGAFLLKLRASTSLARLWRDQGKVERARELLAPVYEWFTEGFDTRDLKEAKALLEELHA